MKKILISNGHCVRLVAQRHIVFCKSDNCYTSFFLDNGDELVVCQSLKKVQQGLDFNIFIRVSQSYLINKEYILLIDKKQKMLELSGGHRIPFTKTLNQLVSILENDALVFDRTVS